MSSSIHFYISEFLEEQAYRGNAEATMTYYRERLTRFVRDSAAEVLDEFEERRIRVWLTGGNDWSRNTFVNYDRALRVFANWLYRRGYTSVNRMERLPKPKEVQTRITVFSHDDLRAILNVARNGNQPMRDVALITLLLDTGLRIGEACNLTLSGIEWSEGFIRTHGKTGERSVPFGRKVRYALRSYVDRERTAATSSERSVFLSRDGLRLRSTIATQHLIRIARRANVATDKVGPHNYRHTFSVEFMRAGGDAFTLQQLLGHSSLSMTRRYVHLARVDLRSAHKRFAPADRIL